MICYYRNNNSYGANRREFEDQSAIKGKCEQIGIRPSWSLIWESKKKKRREREKMKKKKKRKRRKKTKKGMETLSMDLYGLLWVYMDFWTFVWRLVCSIFRV